ncbi:hypothetical protein M569_14559, partial [Genlisea aurea]
PLLSNTRRDSPIHPADISVEIARDWHCRWAPLARRWALLPATGRELRWPSLGAAGNADWETIRKH